MYGTVIRRDLRADKHENILTLSYSGRTIRLGSIAFNPRKPEFCESGSNKYVHIDDKRHIKKNLFFFSNCRILLTGGERGHQWEKTKRWWSK